MTELSGWGPHDLGDDMVLESVGIPPGAVDVLGGPEVSEDVMGDTGTTDAAVSIRLVDAGRVVEWVECSARTNAILWLADSRSVWVARREHDVVGTYRRSGATAAVVSGWVFMMVVVCAMVGALGGSATAMSLVGGIGGVVGLVVTWLLLRRLQGRSTVTGDWQAMDMAQWDAVLGHLWARYDMGHDSRDILHTVDMIVLGKSDDDKKGLGTDFRRRRTRGT